MVEGFAELCWARVPLVVQFHMEGSQIYRAVWIALNYCSGPCHINHKFDIF